MKEKAIKEKIMMVLVLVAVSIASSLMLAGINDFSYDMIKMNKERKLKVAVLSALEIPLGNREPEKVFSSSIKRITTPEGPIYLSTDDRQKGVAFSAKGSGFWGPIIVMVGVDPETLTIKGVEILQQEETPGLGARIEEDRFRNQFKGKSMDTPIRMMIKGAKPGPNDVEAVAGATLSSKFMEEIINEKSKPFIEAVRRLDLD
ncbi:MAG: FMN-binding protein [bacterium]|nr:FMN-binding protein [bacterium]